MRSIAAALIVWLVLAGGAVLAQETPRRGGVLTYPIPSEPDTYDCHAAVTTVVFARVAPHYSTLLKIDAANYPNIVGDAAESWGMASDGLSYNFRLRPGIRFHDGSPLSSADVKATYERIKTPPQGVVSQRQSLYRDIAAIDTPDDLTVIFRLAKPNAAMLTLFASPYNCLYSSRKLAENPIYPKTNIMGTGAFRFVEHVAGSHWTGTRFDGYFRPDRPYLDGFKVFNMAVPAIPNALIAGQVHADFRGLNPAERDRISAARGETVRAAEVESSSPMAVTFNTQRPPFNDPRVRRAMSMAIDRYAGAQVMMRLSFFNRVSGIIRTGTEFGRTRDELAELPGFGRNIEVSRAEARRLLKEAGVADLKATFLNSQLFTPIGIYLIDQWRQIGATVEHVQVEGTRLFGSMRGGEFDMALDPFLDFLDEPSIQFSRFISYDIDNSNVSRAIDRKVDDLYERQVRTLDKAERKKLVFELEAHLLNQAYRVPFLWGQRVTAYDVRMRGYHASPSAVVGFDLVDIWLAQ